MKGYNHSQEVSTCFPSFRLEALLPSALIYIQGQRKGIKPQRVGVVSLPLLFPGGHNQAHRF